MEEFETEHTAGYVYKITNDINDKKYIGITTQSVETRWAKHISNADYLEYHLYRAMRKYGKEHFHIETIEKVIGFTELCEREIYWISYYDSMKNGYNMTIGGEGNRKYDCDTIFALWDDGFSVSDIASKLHCLRSTAYECLRNYYKYSIEESYKRRSESNQKSVVQFSLDGEMIKKYDSVADAENEIGLANCGQIGGCCEFTPGHRTAGGYIWVWEDDIDKVEHRLDIIRRSRRSAGIMKVVEQLTLNGEHIAYFQSAKDAAVSFGRERDSHIVDCCKGRRDTCYGYRWRYAIRSGFTA